MPPQAANTIKYYTTFVLRCATMKPFKIKAIKTYVSYITTFVILHNMCAQKEKKQKTLYNIRLKTSLFKVKLYYIYFMILIYQESQEIWKHEEHTVMQRKPRQQVSNFSSDLHCGKTIFTFLLQIM